MAAAGAFAACSGGNGSAPTTDQLPIPGHPGATTTASVAIAGVGDSLTAGYQSGGISGQPGTSPGTLPGYGAVIAPAATQENGFFSRCSGSRPTARPRRRSQMARRLRSRSSARRVSGICWH
jgi:hypothetical protein